MTEIAGYHLVRRLGSGGMGVVYEAEQLHPRRTVALKVLRADLLSPRLSRRLEIEAEILGRLRHPGIAQIHEAGWFDSEEGRQPFFAMEIVTGDPLDKWAAKRNLSVPARIELLILVCDAVQYAHSRGIVHRDLKPENILIDEHGQPKILDFGLARATDGDVNTLTTCSDMQDVLGTLPYMSPEQTGGDADRIDTRSDVYALGVLGYQLLTGRLPHDPEGRGVLDYIRSIQEDAPRPAGDFNRSCRGDLDIILARALMKEAELRYASPGELAGDLRRFLACKPIRAKKAGAGYHMAKFARRNKALVLGVCATFAALTAGIIGTTVQARRAELRATEAEAARALSDHYRDRAEHQQYLANIRLADMAVRDDQLNIAESALLDSPERLRNWEWGYLWRKSHHEIGVLRGHHASVRDVAYDHAGERIVSVSDDGETRIWDASTGEPLGVLKGHSARISRGRFSPDDRWIATAADDATARIWTRDGTPHAVLAGHGGPVNKARFSPDSSMVLTASDDGTARIWDIRTGATLHVLEGHTDAVFDADWHRSGRWVVTAGDDASARLWEASTGRLVTVLEGHKDEVNAARFNPAGTTLVTVSEEGAAFLWTLGDPADGDWRPRISRVRLESSLIAMWRWAEFTPDGSMLVLATRLGTVGIWDGGTGELVAPAMPRAIEIEGIAIGPEGRKIAMATKQFTVRLLDVADFIERGGEGRVIRGHEAYVTAACFHPRGDSLATGSTDATLRVWPLAPDLKTDRGSGREGAYIHVAFTPDSRVVGVSAETGTFLLDAVTSAVIHEERGRDAYFTLADFHPGTMRVVGASDGEPLRIMDAASGRTLSRIPDTAESYDSVRFSPDGRGVLTAGPGPDCALRDTDDGAIRGRYANREGEIVRAVFDPSGSRVVTASDDGIVRVWDAKDQRPLVVMQLDESPYEIEMHPFRPLVAVATRDNRVGIRSIETGEQVATLPAEHSRLDPALAFSPDGERLVIASSRGEASIWDWSVGGELMSINLPNGRTRSLAFSPGGRFLGVAGDQSAFFIFDAGPPPPSVPNAAGEMRDFDLQMRVPD